MYGTGSHREIRMTEHRIGAGIGRPVGGGRRRQQRDLHVTRKEAADEVVDVPFEPAEAMQRIDGSRHNRHTQRLSFTRSRLRFALRPGAAISVRVQRFHSTDDDGDVEMLAARLAGGARRAGSRSAASDARRATSSASSPERSLTAARFLRRR